MITDALLAMAKSLLDALEASRPAWAYTWPAAAAAWCQSLRAWNQYLPVTELFVCCAVALALMSSLTVLKWTKAAIDAALAVIP